MSDLDALTIQELEKMAKGVAQKESSKKDNKTVLNFIKDKGIQLGKVRISTSLIFYEYSVKYKRYNYCNKIGRTSFFHTFAKHFTLVRSNGKRYYLLNECFEITPKKLENAYKHGKRKTK